jgi:hypothetical protein
MPDQNRIPASRAPWRFLLATLALLATAAGIALMVSGGAQASTVTPLDTLIPTPPSGPTLNTSPYPPGVPGNLTAVAHTTSVTLTWTAAERGCCDIVNYDISYFRAFDDLGQAVRVGNVTTVTIPTSSVTQYRFSVAARDSLGHPGQAASITVMTPATDTGDTVPPSTPGTLVLGEVTGTTAALSWSPATDNVGVVGYQVYRYDGWFSSTLLATVTGTSYVAQQAYTSTGTNDFYIRAKDAAGNLSIASNVVGFKTGSLPASWASVSPSASSARPSSPPPLPLSCRAVYQLQSQWQGGFVGTITVTNTGSAPIVGWTLTFTFPGDQHITNTWNGTATQTGSAVTVHGANWNSTIQPGGSVSVGFQGTGQSVTGAPTNIAINGVPCSGIPTT